MITEIRPEVGEGTPTRTPRRFRVIAVVLILLLLAGGFGLRAWRAARPTDVRAGTTVVDVQGLAARYGIEVTLIAVTAAGGLVDFRYQVVDPDKADPIIHDVGMFPKLVVEDSGAMLAMSSLPHNHGTELKLGGNYFFLLANANSALHAGSQVTVVIGDVRLEHVVVQG